MSNFVKKKLETKKREKRSISPGYNWVEKEAINPLPGLPLENKITADDMNYLHALANLPASQIKSYGGSIGAGPHNRVLMTVPADEVFVYAYASAIVNNQTIVAFVPNSPRGGTVSDEVFTGFSVANTSTD